MVSSFFLKSSSFPFFVATIFWCDSYVMMNPNSERKELKSLFDFVAPYDEGLY